MVMLEIAAVVLALVFLLLAIRQIIYCWIAAFVSSLMFIGVYFAASLYLQAALNGFYAAMAIYGWHRWRAGDGNSGELAVDVWPFRRHAVALVVIAVMTPAFAFALRQTGDPHPYLDSVTSIAAVVATFMAAHKILENWIYWLAIDVLSLYLYLSTELYYTAGLFAVYIALAAVGFWQWSSDRRRQQAEPGAASSRDRAKMALPQGGADSLSGGQAEVGAASSGDRG